MTAATQIARMQTHVLVVGGSGGVGGAVMQELLEQGHRVRVSSRTPGARKWPEGVEPVLGDLHHPESMRAAAERVDAVFLYVQGPARETADRLRAAGVKRAVVLSTIDAANDSVAASFNRRRHLAWEEAVASAGFAFTCLRPGAFASNALRFFLPQLAKGNVIRLPFPSSQQAPIDTRDIARVAAVALTTGRLDGQRPVLTGPRSLSQREQVALFAQALERCLEIETVSTDVAREWMSGRIPAPYVEMLLAQWQEETHTPAIVTSEVERITGRPATPYAEALAWALAHRESSPR
jgi:uncharacterized protein YbjT (DUF2867 family)